MIVFRRHVKGWSYDLEYIVLSVGRKWVMCLASLSSKDGKRSIFSAVLVFFKYETMDSLKT